MVVYITTEDDVAVTTACAKDSRCDSTLFSCRNASECATVRRVRGPKTGVGETANGLANSATAGPYGRDHLSLTREDLGRGQSRKAEKANELDYAWAESCTEWWIGKKVLDYIAF
jgi:hypothetical protein